MTARDIILRTHEIPHWQFEGVVQEGKEQDIINTAVALHRRVQDSRRDRREAELGQLGLTTGVVQAILEREAPARHEDRVQWAQCVAMDACGGDVARAYQLLVAELLSADMPEEPGEDRGGMRYIEEFRCLGAGRVDAGDAGAWDAAIIEAARRIGRCTYQRAVAGLSEAAEIELTGRSADRHLRCVGVHLVTWDNDDPVEMSPDPRVRRAFLWAQVRYQLACAFLGVWPDREEVPWRPHRAAATSDEDVYTDLAESFVAAYAEACRRREDE